MGDYASLTSHLFPLLKYTSVLILFFIWLPKLLFSNTGMDKIESFFNGFMRMVLLLIAIIYVLALIKLYEVISLSVILFLYVYFKLLRKHQIDSIEVLWGHLQIFVFNILDGMAEIPDVAKRIGQKITTLINFLRKHVLWFIVGCIVFGYAFWLRAYDAFVHAAPPLSDSYVTLAWMKYISERILFHDGLYPQGFHIILSALSKFSANNPLYVLRYTGPLCGMMTIFGIWFFVFQISRSKTSAYLAAAVYGCTGLYFDAEMFRQAATNSQEFALVFVLPTLWFLMRFYESKRISYLVTAAIGLCIMGSVHSLVLAYTIWLSLAIVLVNLLLSFRETWTMTMKVISLGIAAVLLSSLPLALGYLFGEEAHGSSTEYLFRVSTSIQYAQIGLRELIFIGGVAATMLLFIREWAEEKKRTTNITLIMLFSFAALFYYLFPVLSQSVVLESRKTILTLPFCGVAAGMIHWQFIYWFKGKLQNIVGLGIVVIVLVVIFVGIRPTPFNPWKMERDASVVEYLKIKDSFLPSTWMIVSQEEGYAVVLGSGYHMLVRTFINDIQLDAQTLRLVDKARKPVNVENVFIFYEKEVYRSPYKELNDVYDRREREMPQLLAMLKGYDQRTKALKIYYEDDYLRIYHIHEERSQKEKFNKIWNQ